MAIHWDKVRHFTPKEFDDPDYPGSGEDINPILLEKLVKLRVIADCPIITHWRVGGCIDIDGKWGHTADSYHRVNSACDFHFKAPNTNVNQQFHWVLMSGLTGIGFYPWWRHPGFHVDIRPASGTQLWISPRRGVYEYFLKRRVYDEIR